MRPSLTSDSEGELVPRTREQQRVNTKTLRPCPQVEDLPLHRNMVTVVTMATQFALIDTEGPTLLVGLEFLTHREATEGAGLVSVSQSRSFNPQRINPTTLVLQEQPELQAEQSVSDQLNNQRLLFLPLRTLSFHLTCGDKQDARAEDDVVA